jgi:hypothetical protein
MQHGKHESGRALRRAGIAGINTSAHGDRTGSRLGLIRFASVEGAGG